MKHRTIAIILAVAFSATLLAQASCRTEPAPPPLEPQAVSSSYTAFGIDLLRVLSNERPGTNVFISPASIAFALAMTRGGAVGETRDAMADALHLPATVPGVTERADSALIAGMNETIKDVDLSVANSLWGREGIEFKKDFLARNRRCYGAELRVLDFNDASAPKTINAWVAEKTHDKIKGVVDEISPNSILYLINAIYFKGAWATKFDKDLTEDGPFHAAGGAEVVVPFMNRAGKFEYLEDPLFQAVRLPYGDGRTAMYVFLPDTASSLDAFRAALTPERWAEWLGRFAERDGRLALPRFRREYEAKLKGPLSVLGMAVAFDPTRANFSNMLDTGGEKAYIHDVIHKTFVEVNEEGTEAAAVTSVEMKLTSAMEPPRRFVMVCDRPFFYAIVDSRTGLVLFMGEMANPS